MRWPRPSPKSDLSPSIRPRRVEKVWGRLKSVIGRRGGAVAEGRQGLPRTDHQDYHPEEKLKEGQERAKQIELHLEKLREDVGAYQRKLNIESAQEAYEELKI